MPLASAKNPTKKQNSTILICINTPKNYNMQIRWHHKNCNQYKCRTYFDLTKLLYTLNSANTFTYNNCNRAKCSKLFDGRINTPKRRMKRIRSGTTGNERFHGCRGSLWSGLLKNVSAKKSIVSTVVECCTLKLLTRIQIQIATILKNLLSPKFKFMHQLSFYLTWMENE